MIRDTTIEKAYSHVLDLAGHLQKLAPNGSVAVSQLVYEALGKPDYLEPWQFAERDGIMTFRLESLGEGDVKTVAPQGQVENGQNHAAPGKAAAAFKSSREADLGIPAGSQVAKPWRVCGGGRAGALRPRR